jgi:hypothetical protein
LVFALGASSSTPIDSARVDAFLTGNASSLDSAITDSSGAFSLTVATAGIPLDGYIRARRSGYLDTYTFPSAPLPASISRSFTMLTPSVFGLLSGFLGVTQTAGNGWIAVVVVDCTGNPVAGAAVSTTPPGTVRYDDNSGPSSTASVTGTDGQAYVFNVGAGNVVVAASVGTTTFRSHTVVAVADQITVTLVAPGPTTPAE